MNDDADLLRRYVSEKSQDAFAELVHQHLGFVYHTALRLLDGDTHAAEDVAQTVFTDLTRKAGRLIRYPSIAGWLHTSTRFAALQHRRTERRRHIREQEASLMQELTREATPAEDWELLRPVIDDALQELNDTDREAVILRYFENRAFAEVGQRLNLTADGARSRVERALDKLQILLTHRGVPSTTAALTLALGAQAAPAVPVGLGATVAGAALAGGGAAGLTGMSASIFMSLSKPQIGIAAAVIIAGVSGVAWYGMSKPPAAMGRETEPRVMMAGEQVSPPLPGALTAPAAGEMAIRFNASATDADRDSASLEALLLVINEQYRDPNYRRARKNAYATNVQRIYRPIFEELAPLDPQVLMAFKNLLVERMFYGEYVRLQAIGQGIQPNTDEYVQLKNEILAPVDGEIAGLLGEKAASYFALEKLIPALETFELGMRGRFEFAEVPLERAATLKLAAIMTDLHYAMGDPQYVARVKTFKDPETGLKPVFDRLMAQAEVILSVRQREVLKECLDVTMANLSL